MGGIDLLARAAGLGHVDKEIMKVIIAGSRTIHSISRVWKAIDEAIHKTGLHITEVVSGGAEGVDQIGKAWAYDRGIPSKQFNAHWSKNGKAAGPMRNREMAKYADALIAIWDGKSRGTRNMIEEMKKLGKPFWIETI